MMLMPIILVLMVCLMIIVDTVPHNNQLENPETLN